MLLRRSSCTHGEVISKSGTAVHKRVLDRLSVFDLYLERLFMLGGNVLCFWCVYLQMSGFQTPVVLDTGSSLVKAGFADQDLPTTIFPTAIGLPKYEVTFLKLL